MVSLSGLARKYGDVFRDAGWSRRFFTPFRMTRLVVRRVILRSLATKNLLNLPHRISELVH